MKEIKIFIPKEIEIEIEVIVSNNDKININIPKGLKIDLESSNENEIYIVYESENLTTINDITYEFVEDDCSCNKCEIPRNYECSVIKCTSSQRKDKKEGYFKMIKHINKI